VAVRGAGWSLAAGAAHGALHPPLDAVQAQPITANTNLVRINDMR
jgi:hypothetical protein